MVPCRAILVANSSLARLFERSSLLQPWVEVQDWWHGEGQTHARELERALPGHSMSGRTGLAPHTDTRQRERAVFAQAVAKDLEQAMVLDKWHELEIFASNPFLGELMAHLGSALKKTVRATHPLDLTALSAQEIEARWRKDFMV
jgi:protein required for attachment to host cells